MSGRQGSMNNRRGPLPPNYVSKAQMSRAPLVPTTNNLNNQFAGLSLDGRGLKSKASTKHIQPVYENSNPLPPIPNYANMMPMSQKKAMNVRGPRSMSTTGASLNAVAQKSITKQPSELLGTVGGESGITDLKLSFNDKDADFATKIKMKS